MKLPTEIDVSEPAPDVDGPDKAAGVTRSITVDHEVWTDARVKAIREGKSLSSIIRDLLKQWVNEESSISGSLD